MFTLLICYPFRIYTLEFRLRPNEVKAFLLFLKKKKKKKTSEELSVVRYGMKMRQLSRYKSFETFNFAAKSFFFVFFFPGGDSSFFVSRVRVEFFSSPNFFFFASPPSLPFLFLHYSFSISRIECKTRSKNTFLKYEKIKTILRLWKFWPDADGKLRGIFKLSQRPH